MIAHAVIDVSIKKEQAGDLANVILIDMFQALACGIVFVYFVHAHLK